MAIPLIGAGAMGLIKLAGTLGTAAMVAPPAIDAVTGNTGRGMRKQILSDGPDRSEGEPVFRTNFLQNQFIDEQSLLPQYYKDKKAEVKKDPEVAAVMRQLGPGAVTINDDEDASSVAARYAQDFKDSQVAEALELDKKKRQAGFEDPTAKAQRDLAETARIESNSRFDLAEARNTRLEQERIAERKEGRLDRVDQRMSDRESAHARARYARAYV